MGFHFKNIALVLTAAVLIYILLILLTRLFGLRSFSKMSSFDFAMTVAIGSVVATTVVSEQSMIVEGATALFALYLLQHMVGRLRQKFTWVEGLVDNTPILLMKDGEILEENLAKAKVKKRDLFAKLREANIHKMEEVQAVVMETTGDITVLSSREKEQIDHRLMLGIQGYPGDEDRV